jgi:hypothetical protein
MIRVYSSYYATPLKAPRVSTTTTSESPDIYSIFKPLICLIESRNNNHRSAVFDVDCLACLKGISNDGSDISPYHVTSGTRVILAKRCIYVCIFRSPALFVRVTSIYVE